MATLKREVKKIPSESNLRLLSSLIVSLANKQSSLEDKCIAPWKADETYQKDISYVSHNGYVYICSVTNQDSVFTESHWTKLADDITELSKSDVEAMLNLSQEELDNLQKLLKDDQITTTSTFSSSKIYSDLQAAIDTAKEYTNNQLGKAVKPAYKVVTNTSEVTETGYFYLISNGTNYDMYVLSSDGSVVSLGTSDVDLSDYAKLMDLADYLKKTDAASTYATITTVDGKVDKTNVLTTASTTATDDQVYSAKVMNTELDGVVKKTDISTTIDDTSTNDTVPTNKAIYDSLINKVNNPIVLNTADEVNSYDRGYQSFIIGPSVAEAVGLPKAPDSTWFCINLSHFKGFKYPSQIAFEYAGIERIMYRTAHNGVWHNWRKIPTTSVADVPKTTITISDETNYKNSSGCESFYIVRNGVCYVTLAIDCVTPQSNTAVATIPKALGVTRFSSAQISSKIDGYVLQDGILKLSGGTANTKYYVVSFSYPVAES